MQLDKIFRRKLVVVNNNYFPRISGICQNIINLKSKKDRKGFDPNDLQTKYRHRFINTL